MWEWSIRDESKTFESLLASPLLSRCHRRGQSREIQILYFKVYILYFCALYFVFVVAGQKAEIGYVIWVFSNGYIATHYGPLLLYLLCQGLLQDCHRGLLLATCYKMTLILTNFLPYSTPAYPHLSSLYETCGGNFVFCVSVPTPAPSHT